jgi:tripartite ATP-independent transporter DctP family solute receptor
MKIRPFKMSQTFIMKKFQLIASGLILFLLASCGTNKIKEPEFLIRASLLMNEQHTWFKAFEYFGKQVHKKSECRIKVEVYPSEQLAKEIEAIRMIQAEIIDMTTTGALLNNWIEIASFCEMPFLIENQAQKDALINGEIGEEIKKQILEKTGLRPVAYFQAGPRMLTSNIPIRHPNDLQGLIVRVPAVPSFVTAWQALGAKPTPMAFSEVFTSLQQGTIEAQENPLALIYNAGFAEVQKYVNLTAHVDSWSYVVVGEKQFKSLPADLQKIFIECAQKMQQFEQELYLENETRIRKELENKGMEFIQVDKQAFSEMAGKAIFESLSPEMQKIHTEISSIEN